MRELVLLKYQQKQIATFFCSSKKLIVCYPRVKNRKREDVIFLEVEYNNKRGVRYTYRSLYSHKSAQQQAVCRYGQVANSLFNGCQGRRCTAEEEEWNVSFNKFHTRTQYYNTCVCVYKAHFKVGTYSPLPVSDTNS